MITSKEYCKCPKCGSECEVDTSMILASNPPQFRAFCKKCNEVIYTLCSNVYGEISTNQDSEYHNDIHRIADALEKLAKHFTEDNKIEVKEMTYEEKEKFIKKHLDLTTAPSPSITISNMCEGCWYYELQKANPNPTITIGDTPCTWCPKLQPTCEAINNDKRK